MEYHKAIGKGHPLAEIKNMLYVLTAVLFLVIGLFLGSGCIYAICKGREQAAYQQGLLESQSSIAVCEERSQGVARVSHELQQRLEATTTELNQSRQEGVRLHGELTKFQSALQ